MSWAIARAWVASRGAMRLNVALPDGWYLAGSPALDPAPPVNPS